jgi:hypothetical protein
MANQKQIDAMRERAKIAVQCAALLRMDLESASSIGYVRLAIDELARVVIALVDELESSKGRPDGG